jgi:hypothetical protein
VIWPVIPFTVRCANPGWGRKDRNATPRWKSMRPKK